METDGLNAIAGTGGLEDGQGARGEAEARCCNETRFGKPITRREERGSFGQMDRIGRIRMGILVVARTDGPGSLLKEQI